MPWGRVDDDFYDHPKVEALGTRRLPCVGLYFLAISWSNRYLTDGRVPPDRLRKLGGCVAQADHLVAVGLFDRDGADYLIHDFLAKNKSREQVLAEREQKAEAGRKGGLARGRQVSEQAEGKHSAKQKASTVLSEREAEGKHSAKHPGLSPRPVPTDSLTPRPPQAGARPRVRRAAGDTPRSKGTNGRLLREGTPEVDGRVLASLAERTAAWNASHPANPIPAPKDQTPDWIGGGKP